MKPLERQDLTYACMRWRNLWINDKPFDATIMPIQQALSFCKNADDVQEIRDLIEENEVPLSLADAWLIFPTMDANRLSKTDDCIIER